ncbi:isoleucine--tRNA ligase [Candidatus Woesearchaeota archaeon]|nr:isoleucine--tRNA ligase [Candidatus Woesearchaeota archaeon]
MYNFKEVEEHVLTFWEDNQVYAKVKGKNKVGKKFYFLQGPPYTSGRLHIGHAWNNSLKDIALRYKRMKGFNVWDRAGYDMHGLPTENKVQASLKLKYKEDIVKYGVGKFIKECINFSVTNAQMMDKDLWRLGVWMDYPKAYYPIRNSFISGEWWLIKKAHQNKRLYKGKKVMHWCASCETTLAKHELEYESVKENSIFLKFKVRGTKNDYLIIWTTTPWTIPFNLAVMVHPEFEYVKAKVDDEVWILAKVLAGTMIGMVANKKMVVLEELKGKELEGLRYEHPFYEELEQQYNELARKSKNIHTVVLSEHYVTLDAGSGLVHCAPGCGPEDYEVGQAYGLPPFNNLDEKGLFFDMGKFTGWKAKDDDKKFVEELKNKKSLIAITPVEHDYAHCWRCHNPVVFRTTLQWFLKIEDLIPKMLESAEKINWVPKQGKQSFHNWIKALKDNSISRQRFWGAPLPIWECESCKSIEVVGSIEELKQKATTSLPEDLHKPWIDGVKIKCGCGSQMQRVPDVLDVWIDAGTLSWNCLDYPSREDFFKELFPAEFILEATEQVKLWFSMMHICSAVALNKPCFKNVYMHGMILDYQGMKMSKSLGNIISPYEVVDKYGADVLRYYMCGMSAGENINFNWEDVKIKQRNLFVLWNIHKYLIDLHKETTFDPENAKAKLGIEEKYILSRLHSTLKEVSQLFEEYKLDETISVLEKLFLDLSRTYIQLVRDKVGVGSEEEKMAVTYALYKTLLELVKAFSTIAPFLSEEIYQNLKEEFKLKEESIHLYSWPKYKQAQINQQLENEMVVASNIIQAVLAAREKAQLGVRWPIQKMTVLTQNKEARAAIERLSKLILYQTNIKNLEVKEKVEGVEIQLSPNKGFIGKEFKQDAPKILAKINDAALQKIYAEGKCDIDNFELTTKHINFLEKLPENLTSAPFKHGYVYIDTKLTAELESEGFCREIIRRIQNARKDESLKKTDVIQLAIHSAYSLAKWEGEIKKKVGAKSIAWKKHAFKKSWQEEIKNQTFEISLEKI